MIRPFACWLFLFLAGSLSAQVYQGEKLVEASLLAETTAIIPGQPFRLGLHLRMAPGWHTYWKNAGDAGLPTTLDLELPAGFETTSMAWPLPHRIIEPGDIEVYAYKDETLLFVTITPPATATGNVTIRAKSTWLVCEEVCIPGETDLELTLPVADTAKAANTVLFQKFLAQLPSEQAPPFQAIWTATPTGWNLGLEGVTEADQADFFPYDFGEQWVDHTAPSKILQGAANLTIPVANSALVRGIILLENGERKGWIVESKVEAGRANSPLWTYLFFGFLGGIILNLMPCVLPVISLKIFGFIHQAGDSRASILRHGLAFTGGIFVWFLGLAAVIIALKASGSEVSWAFQFQNPWFNFVIGAIVFLFALNLFGVFEIILPGRAATGIAHAGSHGGLGGSFAQGILATLLATPCTAPFLGTALGFAFGQTSAVIAAMFASIAAGMSAPYILLSAQPGWMKFLPKPGAWMERLRQFMGFPLAATLIWLLFVIGQQRGSEAVIWALATYLLLGLSAWLYGTFLGPLDSGRTRFLAFLGILLSLTVGLGYFAGDLFARAAAGQSSTQNNPDGIPWVPYSEEALQKLLAENKPVFLDFTADWCITCKYNEASSINTEAVRQAFEKGGIVAMKADWTNSNPAITKKLAEFDRVGVPFYLFYGPEGQDDPVILPELLTENIVLRVLSTD